MSVTALADDLRRYLRNEPISARPDTLRYRAAKFIGRHARGVATSVAVILLLAGSTAFYTTRLATERDRAQREATKAAQVSEALTGLLMGADPIANRATGEALTVRGLLDAGAERAQKELAGYPDAQAEILTVLGRIYRQFGVYDKAQQLLEQALASGQQAFGAEHVRVARTLNDLGAVLEEQGRIRGGRAGPGAIAGDAPQAAGIGARRRRRHDRRARTRLPGPGIQPALRAAAARSPGDQTDRARG